MNLGGWSPDPDARAGPEGGGPHPDLQNSPVSNPVFRFATVSGQTVHWFLKRNCSITPGQLGWFYASLCALSLGIAGAFWLLGARLILPLAGLELAAVGAALLHYARHAADGERIALQDGRLVVELENAGAVERTEFLRHQVRVQPRSGGRALIEVSDRQRSVRVGRHVRPELRPALARDIRMALRGT